MASFGEALVGGFTQTYGTLARGALQAEQAAYYRNQREGTEEFQRRGRELQRELGIDPNAPVPAPQAAPEQGQAPAAQPQQGAVQGALGGAPATAAQPQPQQAPAPAPAPQAPPQAPVQTGVATGAPDRRPPVSPEDFERAANSGDPILMASAAGAVVGAQGGVPGQVGDTQGPRQLVNEVAAANGGVRGPLTRKHWNIYYERRINDAMELLPPDQAVRVVGMLDQQRQRGFGQMVSLAVASAEAGDAEGTVRALFGASNFNPDGFKDDFRVAPGGRGIEIIRTPESGQGEPQRMIVPLNQVPRYATALLDPKWSMTHQLQVRQLDESARAARVREGQQAQELRLREGDRAERRAFDARGGEAINLTRSIARMEGEYEDAVTSGNNEQAEKLRASLDTERGKLTDVLSQGVSTSAAAGMTRAETDAARTRIQARVAATRQQRVNTLEEVMRDSLALRERALDDAMARHSDRYDASLERLSQQERIVAVREDYLRARVARDNARDEESRKRAEAVMGFTERRIRVLERGADRRDGEEGRITPQTRTEADRAINDILASPSEYGTTAADLRGNRDVPGIRTYSAGLVAANSNLPAVTVLDYMNQYITNLRNKRPTGAQTNEDFSVLQIGPVSIRTSPEIRELMRSVGVQAPRAPSVQDGAASGGAREPVASTEGRPRAAPSQGGAVSSMIQSGPQRGQPPARQLPYNIQDPLNYWIYRNVGPGKTPSARDIQAIGSRVGMTEDQVRNRIAQVQAAAP